MANKTNVGLVEFAQKLLKNKTNYVMGTNCRVLTESIYNSLVSTNPNGWFTASRKNVVKKWIGQVTTDCHGLIEGYLNDSDNDGAVEKGEGTYDVTADMAFNTAKEKGVISTIPEIPGICVRYKGHVGIYIGSGKVIEARGFDYGVCETEFSKRSWTHWYKHPRISYVAVCPFDEPKTNLKKGTKGESVKWLQWHLNRAYTSLVVDGIFGNNTYNAVIGFQKKYGLIVDGIVGKNTRAKLKDMLG